MCDNSELHYIFYDTFNGTYVEKRDINVPPERYATIFRGVEKDLFTESWFTTNQDGMVLSIAYSKDDVRREKDVVYRLRREAERKHNVVLLRMRHMTIPPYDFDKLIINMREMQSI